MKFHKNRSPWCVVVSGLTGIIVFLVLLVILGYLASYFHNAFLLGFVELLEDNLALIITMGIVFMVADVFLSFRYPFNLPGPLFSGLGSLLVVSFIVIILNFFDLWYGTGMSVMFSKSISILSLLVFFIVIITGYARIFFPEKIRDEMPREEGANNPACPVCPSWGDVGNEIRQAIFDLFHRFREEINRK
jgi:sensor histidine kinase YesM